MMNFEKLSTETLEFYRDKINLIIEKRKANKEKSTEQKTFQKNVEKFLSEAGIDIDE